ncbi:1837_t:CDS:1 [Paraglomus brasilianum]|uniref:1837_t:CDS:1 n=1 Tax=Paraglomus brasilianum TaxID=144538 RepID=A0A9N9H1R2_9GLOM|nr:1837_t:CDS:1 [Paraglomus brasilianum]
MSFKCHDRSHFVKWLLGSGDEHKKLDVLTAARFVARVWNEVSPKTIPNFFQQTKIFNEKLDINDDDLMRSYAQMLKVFTSDVNYSEESETEEIPTDKEIVDLVTYQKRR